MLNMKEKKQEREKAPPLRCGTLCLRSVFTDAEGES